MSTFHAHNLLVFAADHVGGQSPASHTIRVEAFGVSSNIQTRRGVVTVSISLASALLIGEKDVEKKRLGYKHHGSMLSLFPRLLFFPIPQFRPMLSV